MSQSVWLLNGWFCCHLRNSQQNGNTISLVSQNKPRCCGNHPQDLVDITSKMSFNDAASYGLKQQHAEYILIHVRCSDSTWSCCVLGSGAFDRECFLSHTMFCSTLQSNSDLIVTLSRDDEQMRTESPNVTFNYQPPRTGTKIIFFMFYSALIK